MAISSNIVYCTDQDVFDRYNRISAYDYKQRLLSNWSKSGSKYTLNDFKFIGDEVGLVGSDRIIQLYANGEDLGPAKEDLLQVISTGHWFITLTIPRIIYRNTSNNPNDMIMELGEDRSNMMLRFRKKASRIVESILGFTISREIMKDREGNYPTSLIEATALKTALLFVKAYNPTSPDVSSLEAEFDDIMNKIVSGKIVMSGHRTKDDSKGIIREVNQFNLFGIFETFGRLRPVELRGNFLGSVYELLRVKINQEGLSVTAEEIGDAKFNVWGKTSTNLKQQLLVDAEIITGDYQSLGVDNLEIRFGGKYPTETTIDGATYSSRAFSTDEYEIELWGGNIQPTVSQINSTRLTKRDRLWH